MVLGLFIDNLRPLNMTSGILSPRLTQKIVIRKFFFYQFLEQLLPYVDNKAADIDFLVVQYLWFISVD